MSQLSPSPPCSCTSCSGLGFFFAVKIPRLSLQREPEGEVSPTPRGSSSSGRPVRGIACRPVIRALQMLSPTQGFFLQKP